MIELRLREIAEITGGEARPAGGDTLESTFAGTVDTDSRLIHPGDIFVAKPGEVTDGHLFAPKAVENGASLLLVERALDLPVTQVIVDDAVLALGRLATEVVTRVKSRGELVTIAVTGSNGKTTTKNLLREIFEARGETVAPVASFNNEVGAPLTFLKLTERTQTLIAEMGASAPGEIRRLIAMAKPDVGIVLTVGLAHAGEFGGIEVTLTSKTEMVQGLVAGDTAVLNADDARVASMADKTEADLLWFGRSERADVRASDVSTSLDGTEFTLHLPAQEPVVVRFSVIGEHHVTNALAAAAAAHTQGVPATEIRDALQRVTRAEQWRMELQHAGSVNLINDAYNASPDSMAAALKTIAQIAPSGSRTVAVLGAMSELGDSSIEEHDRLGLLAVRLGIDQLVVVGREARALHLGAIAQGSWDGESIFVESMDEAYELLVRETRPGDLVLVKSSNSAGLRHLGDRFAEHLRGHFA